MEVSDFCVLGKNCGSELSQSAVTCLLSELVNRGIACCNIETIRDDFCFLWWPRFLVLFEGLFIRSKSI